MNVTHISAHGMDAQPVVPSEDDRSRATHLRKALEALLGVGSVRLQSADGESIEVPDNLARILARASFFFERGSGVSVVPVECTLTTQQAASLLNESRPFIVRLLDTGEIDCQLVGTHGRVRLEDVLEYRQRRSRQ